MAKLVIIFDNVMSKEGSRLTNYWKLISDLTNDESGKKSYQGVQIKHFKRATRNVREQYLSRVQTFSGGIEMWHWTKMG